MGHAVINSCDITLSVHDGFQDFIHINIIGVFFWSCHQLKFDVMIEISRFQ